VFDSSPIDKKSKYPWEVNMRKNAVHKKEIIDYLLETRTALKNDRKFSKLYRQIPDVVEYIRSHDIPFEYRGAESKRNIMKADVFNTLVWLAKIVNKIWCLINADNTTDS